MLSSQLRIANCEIDYRNSQFAIYFQLSVATITLIGWLLRLPLLNRFPFREDEAIYSYWAFHFGQVDPFFLQVWPDKPPVFIGALALVFQLLGVNQISAQWFNIAISTVTIPVVAALARRCWGRCAGLMAALALALNPFAISFAPTAYTDPLLVLSGLLAFYFALTQYPFWAGIWLAVAIMTKQQGVLYLPLVVAALATRHPPLATRPSPPARPFLLGLTLILLPILYWDSLRWAVAPSPWDLSIRHYGALTLLPPDQWPERLAAWLPLVWYLTASWWVWGGLALLILFYGLQAWSRPGDAPDQPDTSLPKGSYPISQSLRHLVTLSPCHLVTLWSLFFLLAHLFTSVQPWDRYLLPLAPMVALISGAAGGGIRERLSARNLFVLTLCVGLLLLLPPAWQAARGRLPIGGDHGAYQGLIEALDWVRREQPASVILYQRGLGWHYQFYLYDQVSSGAYELRWFPHAVYLAANAAQAAGQLRLLIEPGWASTVGLQTRLAQRGLHLETLARFGHFTVYRLVEWRSAPCRWCYCGPRWTLVPLISAEPEMMSLR